MSRLDLTFEQYQAVFARARSRGGKSTNRLRLYCIEGEHVTAAQVGERLGYALKTAECKLRRARMMPGPVTWERLREVAS